MIAHFDCIAGASGDMLLAALFDAGASVDAVTKQIAALKLGDVQIEVDETHRKGIRATTVSITGTSSFRTYAQARSVLEDSDLDEAILAPASDALLRLATAESRVHGVDLQDVHFHEVSAVDTIADIVGFFAALKDLGIRSCTSSAIPTGWGMVSSQHGQIPVPAPAVLELLKQAELRQVDILAELITPTGAAILASVVEGFGMMPAMKVDAIGYGAGSRELDIPNVLRVVIGEPAGDPADTIEEVLIEANIDDMNPELYGYVSEKLFDAGAYDVWLVPVIGKRGRPANVISVLAPPPVESAVKQILVTETSTIGVRSSKVDRWMLARHWIDVSVATHPVRVKIATFSDQVVNVAPEYSDCVRVAELTGLPLKEVFRQAAAQAHLSVGTSNN